MNPRDQLPSNFPRDAPFDTIICSILSWRISYPWSGVRGFLQHCLTQSTVYALGIIPVRHDTQLLHLRLLDIDGLQGELASLLSHADGVEGRVRFLGMSA